MSDCQSFAQAVLDEMIPRPEGFAAHLAGCEACRALRDAHRGAQLLQGVTLARTERVPIRQLLLRASTVAVVLAVAATGWVFSRPQPVPPAPVALQEPVKPLKVHVSIEEPPLEVEQPAIRAAPAVGLDDGSGQALAELTGAVGRYARVNPVTHGYGPRWKSLPALLAPRRSQPLATLEKVFHPLVYTSEE